jgi:hypothetical protein
MMMMSDGVCDDGRRGVMADANCGSFPAAFICRIFPSTHHFVDGLYIAVALSVLRFLLNLFVFVVSSHHPRCLQTRGSAPHLPVLRVSQAPRPLLSEDKEHQAGVKGSGP